MDEEARATLVIGAVLFLLFGLGIVIFSTSWFLLVKGGILLVLFIVLAWFSLFG